MWSPFDIPDSTGPVAISRLRVEPDTRAQVLMVRFPDGWARPHAGSYEASEEMIVLEGTLVMNGEVYVPGDWAFIPAGQLRDGTEADGRVVALARFGGPARWRREGSEIGVVRASLDPSTHTDPQPSPVGSGRAFHLRAGKDEDAWLVEDAEAGATCPVNAEIFDTGAHTWTHVGANDQLPALRGPIFCRTYA